MNAIEFINTLKPLLVDYQESVDREAKAADDRAAHLKIIGFLFMDLAEDQREGLWENPFTVLMPHGGAFEVTWGDGAKHVPIINRRSTFKELLPQEGDADAV